MVGTSSCLGWRGICECKGTRRASGRGTCPVPYPCCCLLPVEGTGRKQPHSCSGPLSGALNGPANFIVSFHILQAVFPGDIQRWGPGGGEVLLAAWGLPGSHAGWRNLLGLLSLLYMPSCRGKPCWSALAAQY